MANLCVIRDYCRCDGDIAYRDRTAAIQDDFIAVENERFIRSASAKHVLSIKTPY